MTKLITTFVSAMALACAPAFAQSDAPEDGTTEKSVVETAIEASVNTLDKAAILAKAEQQLQQTDTSQNEPADAEKSEG
ncbi:hypothetical protein [Ponticaulis sp.]|uniref:hypothetical protein n=1 Tax=Ponticaulis sp. TaxID=2020902 RepID=UPI0026168A14|nr:hypothetical protein [Ponticaulis sp.]MDF1680608.1 hypothetical protein [Ponticaulis sp.]